MTGTILSGNVAKGGSSLGGAIYSPPKTMLTVTGATFEDNSSVEGGGGIATAGALTVSSDVFQSNTSGDGGAIFIALANLTIIGNTTFERNSALSDGGDLYSDDGTATIGGNTTFEQNAAENDGGAVYNVNGAKQSLSITGVTFTNNIALVNGGAIASDGTLTLSGVTLSSNTAGQLRRRRRHRHDIRQEWDFDPGQ